MALTPAENETADRRRCRRPSPVEAGGEERGGPTSVAGVRVGAGHDDRELVAADPERPVASGAGTSR